MNNPQALFFDTGILIALFNKSEETIADQVYSHLEKLPHASRHVVGPCLVELFYKLRKKFSPQQVYKNLEHLGITLFPLEPAQEIDFFTSYCQITYKNDFDYADYFVCRAALLFSYSHILTVDRDDLPLALWKAQEQAESGVCAQLLPFAVR